eukprot:TRINITY_DN2149_c0_g1_i1.p1 TRINITY_DN2149_c0_g1~~TRINITY_DN2149_c0_g1_i1.p1  ORF type:complete len:329 (+),score=100.45 TRINITY_DN2149_c0_g1_i1:236-1222(+)
MTSYLTSMLNSWSEMSMFPGTPRWTAESIPNLTGTVALVTGGNSGIGKETCVELAKKGAKVYMGARNPDRALPALEEIKKRAGDDAQVFFLQMDLEDLESVKKAAQEFQSKEKELHLFYQNAGVMATPYTLTKDGFENQWGTNVVGHFALLKHLLPLLLSTAKKYPQEGRVRVINVSSYGHHFAPNGGIHFENVNLPDHSTWTRYGQSKLGNILMSRELVKRHGGDGIYSLSLHPGNIQTELTRGPAASYGAIVKYSSWFNNLILIKAPLGAITQLYAGTSPEVVEKHLNGAYLVPFAREFEPTSYATDPELASKLWEFLEKQVEGKL